MNPTVPPPAPPDLLDLWNQPLEAQERDRLLDTLAEAIRRRGIETPTLLFLELHRPLGFIAGQGLIALTPLLGPLLGLERLQNLGRLLADPDALTGLTARLQPHREEEV